MHIDLQTLSVVTVFIAALLGALLVFAGLQNRSVRAPMWWGAAHIVNASGFALLTSRGTVPGFVTIDLANALVLFGYGLTWTGARVFDSRPIRPFLVLVAPLVWLLLCRIPVFADSVGARVIFASSMLALLTLLAAQEFWRGRGEPLMSRWPTVIVLIAHALILLVRVPAVLLSATFRGDFVLSTPSFTLLAFGTLLFTVVLAFLQ
ncbi:MAG TPA: GGDEF domain-containing protein, partial [Xanthobacteraceae bacterium]|nr:GGDEF domain-containing protein [Xanthobacteraceae bacterium]